MRLHYGVLACAITAASTLVGADWTHWRGPEQNGISRDTNLVDTWSLNPEDPAHENVLWSKEIGGRSTPIILNDRLYFNSRTPHDVNDPKERIHAREQVVCMDALTGEIIWRDEFNVFQTDVPAPRVGWASMAGDSETGFVYVHSASGLFRCYDADGKLQWEHSLLEEFGRISGYGSRMCAPTVDEDRVILGFMAINWGDYKAPPPKQKFYAFDKRTGDVLYISEPGGRPNDTTYSNPIVAVIDGVRMLICGNGDGSLCAWNAHTGEPLWTFKMSKRGVNVSPVVDGKYVYVAHGEDNVDSIEFGRVQCVDGSGRGDITETGGVWRVDGLKVGYASLLLKDGILYAVSDTGMLHAFDSQTGERLWDYKIGTVGKGSPVWADGKIYVMEVNGNIHILQASRAECKKISHVRLRGTGGESTDEIYASPAISNGRILLVTRDRTICLAKKGQEPTSEPIPQLPEEAPPQEQVATVQLVPYEIYLRRGESAEYQLRKFDKNGQLIGTETPELEADADLTQIEIEGAKITAPADAEGQGGHVFAKLGDLTVKARVRVFPPLPWSWDFNTYKERDVPPNWVNAFNELRPMDVNGDIAMYQLGGAGKPGTYAWFGTPDMTGYTVQADVMLREKQRRLSSAGITVQRYNLILKGNTGKLGIHTWPPHIRMDKEMKFDCQPETWYRMKLRVDPTDDGCIVRGKIWPREEDEPEKWTLEAPDPHPNETGSPGLYIFGLAETFFDNVKVFEEKE